MEVKTVKVTKESEARKLLEKKEYDIVIAQEYILTAQGEIPGSRYIYVLLPEDSSTILLNTRMRPVGRTSSGYQVFLASLEDAKEVLKQIRKVFGKFRLEVDSGLKDVK